MDLITIKRLIAEGKEIKFYQRKSWRKLRQKALERDRHECQRCKRDGRVTTNFIAPNGDTLLPLTPSPYLPYGRPPNRGRTTKRKNVLQVHHIKELKDFPHLALVLANLETLCIWCHNEEHDRLADYQEGDKFVNEERW
ncbi:putative endonuclease [Bacillus sp. TS-2]|nr:putative endonuclease [Bacillus sp. TS-2]